MGGKGHRGSRRSPRPRCHSDRRQRRPRHGAPRPIEGSEQIARAYVGIAGKAPNLTLLERTVNGQPGLVAQLDGVTVTVYAFEIADDRIKRVWAVRNPEKLRTWTTG